MKHLRATHISTNSTPSPKRSRLVNVRPSQIGEIRSTALICDYGCTLSRETTIFPDDVAPVFADPNALQLALLNLAVNARDAMHDSGVVTISARNGSTRDPSAECIIISVADTGEGMTPEVRQRIFEPFFTTKETGKGSGLGLSLIHI